MKLKKLNIRFIIVCFIWTLLIMASFIWSYQKAKTEQRRLIFQIARSTFRQVLDFREWNMSHGGIYAKVTDSFRPNPYLNVPERDIFANNGELTLINPSFMTREISEITSGRSGVTFHMTSLMPIRPENMPDDMEKKALEGFEKGEAETGEFLPGKDRGSFFYMAPLRTGRDCLRCHASQGYRENDIRGGISINIPFVPEIPAFMLIIIHAGVLLIGLSGIIISGYRLDTAYETIKKLAVTDPLTGIPNRLRLAERARDEFNRCRRERTHMAVIMADIDYFKNYNDEYGHIAGDECLKKVALAIQGTLKRPGDFCARYGGEEFIVILPGTSPEGALLIAEEIRKNILLLGIENKMSAVPGIVSLSLGVVSEEAGKVGSYEELIRMADSAMYSAKNKGRDRVEVHNGEK